jgi:uncharacterized protein YbjT (DUF2867 family)
MALRKRPHPERDPERSEGEQSKDAPSQSRAHLRSGEGGIMRLARATVLGGSGFIGRYIVQRLAAKGTVVAVVSRHARDAGFLRPLGDVGQIALIDASLGDEARLAASLDGADAVVCSVSTLYETRRQTFAAVNVEGPARLARLAQAAGVKRFVHLSGLGADINSPAAFARSKAEGEAAVRAAFPGATILRPSVVFGPEDAFFNRFAGMAQLLPFMPVICGETRFQPVYVGDVADAVMAALARPDTAGAIFELGGPYIWSFRELLAYVLAETHRRRRMVTIPMGLARIQAAVLELLPGQLLLTRDQVRLLEHDSIVQHGAPGLTDLGVTPTAVELVLPTYLEAYRRGGRYAGTRTILAGPSEG